MIAVVVPNWNGKDVIGKCLQSLQGQSLSHRVIVVENGSVDGSARYIESSYPKVKLTKLPRNRGFAGGVNVGIKAAIAAGCDFVALFNNDATADPQWLSNLYEAAQTDPRIGIVTGKLMQAKNRRGIDSTGEAYSTWGLPFPRGRGEIDHGQYDKTEAVFAASGGASLYRVALFADIGLFDEAFFAYYEDVDISFRAQLRGWRVIYEPTAIAHHQIGATSSRLGEFTRYHTLKNTYFLYWKNMPGRLFWTSLPRFVLSFLSLFAYNLRHGLLKSAFKAWLMIIIMFVPILLKRAKIQRRRIVPISQIAAQLYPGIPPTQTGLLKLAHKIKKTL